MRRRWLLTVPNAPKNKFNDTPFPLNDPDADGAQTYDVSGSVTTSLAPELPAGLRELLSRPRPRAVNDFFLDVGLAVDFCSVWWFEVGTLHLWCWHKDPSVVHKIKLSETPLRGLVIAGGRIDSELCQIVSELVPADKHFQDLGPRERADYIDRTALIILGDREVMEVALRGSEEDGVIASQPRRSKHVEINFDISSPCIAHYHQRSGRTFIANGNRIYEYRSWSIPRLNLDVRPQMHDTRTGTLASLAAIGQKVRSIFNGSAWQSAGQTEIRAEPSIRALAPERSFLSIRGGLRGAIVAMCDGPPDTVLLATSSGEIYCVALVPACIYAGSESHLLTYEEQPTFIYQRPILTSDALLRSIVASSEFVNCRSVSESEESLKQQLRGKLQLVAMTAVGGRNIEVLLSDGSRATFSVARATMTSGDTSISESGKRLHDALQLRSDNLERSIYKISRDSNPVGSSADLVRLRLVRFQWPPISLCPKSPIYALTQKKTDSSVPAQMMITTAASSGVSHSGATTAGCWVAHYSAGALVLAGKYSSMLEVGGGADDLWATTASQLSHRFRKLVQSGLDQAPIWDIKHRIDTATADYLYRARKNDNDVTARMMSSYGFEGMPDLSLLKGQALGGILTLTRTALIGHRRMSYADMIAKYLGSLQSLIDSLFKDLSFALPFMPQGGMHNADPRQLVANLERCATAPLSGLNAWAELAARSEASISTYDLQSALARSIQAPEATWLFRPQESSRAIDMCWHYLALNPGAADRSERPPAFAYLPENLSAAEKAADTCCKLLFSLASLRRLCDRATASSSFIESDTLQSFRRFILQLLTDFSRQSLFKIVAPARGILSIKSDQEQPESSSANPSASKKRSRRDMERGYGTAEASLTLSPHLTAEEYEIGRTCCEKLQTALHVYDEFIKSQVSLDVRNKVQEDAAQFDEVHQILETMSQVFKLMSLLAEQVEAELNDNVKTLRRVKVGGTILDYLSRISCASLVGEVIIDSENSILRKWFDEGSLQQLIPPSSLLAECPDLFDKPSLEWAAAIEPMKQIADSFTKAHFDRRRQQAERVAAQARASRTDTPADVGTLEYLYNLWEEELDSHHILDLDIALPLPSSVREGGNPSSEVFNLAVGSGLRAEARALALKALHTFFMVGRDKNEASKDDMFKQFLEVLFRIHAFDFFHLTLATWADVLSRYHIWTRTGDIVNNYRSELAGKISETVHQYLDRLATIVITTDKILGWDLLIALIRQLTCSEIPIFFSDVDHESMMASLTQYEQPIAHCVFSWMIANTERSPLSLSAILESLKSPHIASWLELQNHRNDAAAAYKLSSAVGEVYLSQKDYGQALSHFLRCLEAQPHWLELPVRPEMLWEVRLSPEAGDIELRMMGGTLSCVRGVVDASIQSDLRAAFRSKLLGSVESSESWKIAVQLVQQIRKAGSFPLDQRLDVLLKCLVLSCISDAGGAEVASKRNLVESATTRPTPTPTSQLTLLSSRIRGMLSQSQPSQLLMQLTKYPRAPLTGSTAATPSTLPDLPLRSSQASGMLSARRFDSVSRSRWSESRRLSPRNSQILPVARSISSASAQPGNSPMLYSQLQSNLYGRDEAGSAVLLLNSEEAEKMKALSLSQGMVLDKMAEGLPLPSYVAKHATASGLCRTETESLRLTQTKLLTQWTMLMDMTEYLSYLLLDDALRARASELLKIIANRDLTNRDFFDNCTAQDELLRNALGLIAKLLHSDFGTSYALIDCVLKLATANYQVAPLNLISVLECWASLNERRLRICDTYSLLPKKLSSINGDLAITIAVVNSTIAERLGLATLHKNHSVLSDMLIRFWNIFANSVHKNGQSERQTERRILIEGNAATPLRLLPPVLWRFMSARLLDGASIRPTDLNLLAERKIRLNTFCNVWNAGLRGESDVQLFVYESCVRVFIWDLVGLTRSALTANAYDSVNELIQMSVRDPRRVIAILTPATHWLYTIGMTLAEEENMRGSPKVSSAEFANAASALCTFFGSMSDRPLLEAVFSAVTADLITLITWLAHIALPGLEEYKDALAGIQNAPDLRFLAPKIRDVVKSFDQNGIIERKCGRQLPDELDHIFGHAFSEGGSVNSIPLLQGAIPQWLSDAKSLLPPATQKSAGGTTDLVDALLDSVAAASVLAAQDQDTQVVATLNTILKNYKICLQPHYNYSANGSV